VSHLFFAIVPRIVNRLHSSGQAALFVTITALAQTGSNVVVASTVSESSARQFRYRLPPLGITARFVSSEAGHVEQAIDDHTKAVFVESVSTPDLLVTDLKTLAAVAHKAGVPFVVKVPKIWCHEF
jgi:O-acetylhomoserine/O-acetylserine sulfhydrylase